MSNFFYTLIIYPLVQIIEVCYLVTFRIFHNSGLALCAVSLAVSTLTLPLYFMAEKWQRLERDTQKALAPKIAKIKAVFKGDEQYLILSTLYRQNRYHPLYALRSSIGLLIQVPFFIAAYSYLSRLDALTGASFVFIRDLGAPDAAFTLGAFPVNLLPIAMTAVNIAAGAIYTKGFAVKEKVQLYAMAALFLVLLYNSPAGLVLYWTLNNVFSLVKNCLQKTKNAPRIVYGVVAIAVAAMDVFLLFFHPGDLPNRLLVMAVITALLAAPLLRRIPFKIRQEIPQSPQCFVLSCLILFILAGLVIPATLVASDVAEFSFLEHSPSPLSFVAHTLLQSAGFFLIWPLCLYLLFPGKTRRVFTAAALALAFFALIDVFLPDLLSPEASFGFLTNTLIFSDPKTVSSLGTSVLVNLGLLALGAIALGVSALWFAGRKKRLRLSLQTIALIALAAFGIANLQTIRTRYATLAASQTAPGAESITPGITLSRTEKNVLVIMADAAVGFMVPYVFDEKPDLAPYFSGFTWYPNCVSFADHTLIGAPPIYGGYEYTPRAINERASVPLVEKHKEAYLLLPLLFNSLGFQSTVTDPPFDNYHMTPREAFADYPEVRVENLEGKYTSAWLRDHPDVQGIDISALLRRQLIRFSFFKLVPLVLRPFIYDQGNWFSTANRQNTAAGGSGLTPKVINDYALLDILPALTAVTDDSPGTYTAFYAHLTHDPIFFQAPDYTPQDTVTDRGSGPFADVNRFHTHVAAFALLARYFRFLQDNGVYDNTRIIIVADHGRGSDPFNENIPLPKASHLQSFNPLFMLKNFASDGTLITDTTFMTNADVPRIALAGIAENPRNPFTQAPLDADPPSADADIVTIGALSSYRHGAFTYSIPADEWLHVHDNIFDPANWNEVKP